MEDVKLRAKELREQLNYHKKKYYVEDIYYNCNVFNTQETAA